MKSDLYNIYNTMSESLEMLIDKENTLNHIYTRASQIKDDANDVFYFRLK